jgi:hypothetical protein
MNGIFFSFYHSIHLRHFLDRNIFKEKFQFFPQVGRKLLKPNIKGVLATALAGPTK